MLFLFIVLAVGMVTGIAAGAVLILYPALSKHRHTIEWLVAFAAGGLLGDVFFHIIPEVGEEISTEHVGIFVIGGMLMSFIIERYIHFHHCHDGGCAEHLKKTSLPVIMFVGDAIHNFIDGIAIGASFFVSIPIGLATTLAVMFHEIPQELGDTAIMAHSGYSLHKALRFNILTACTAFLGAGLSIVLGFFFNSILPYLLSIAAGNFIYLAAADIIPHLHQTNHKYSLFFQPLALIAGVLVMWMLLGME